MLFEHIQINFTFRLTFRSLDMSLDSEPNLNQPGTPCAADPVLGTATQSRSENILKFICDFKPGGGLSLSSDEALSADAEYESVSVVLPAQCSIYQLRLHICMQVNKSILCIFVADF